MLTRCLVYTFNSMARSFTAPQYRSLEKIISFFWDIEGNKLSLACDRSKF